MKQKVVTPKVSDCWCGAKSQSTARDFRGMYRVMCDNNHSLTKECITINRAVHRRNNRVLAIKTQWVSVDDQRIATIKYSRKDVPDDLVVAAIYKLKEAKSYHIFPYTLLSFWTGAPEKVCYSAMERAYGRGYIECGVSLRSGWLTEKGIELLREENNV